MAEVSKDPDPDMYLHARYYDPQIGIFLSPDRLHPKVAGVGSNRYTYAFGNPVKGTDRSGQMTTCASRVTEEYTSYTGPSWAGGEPGPAQKQVIGLVVTFTCWVFDNGIKAGLDFLDSVGYDLGPGRGVNTNEPVGDPAPETPGQPGVLPEDPPDDPPDEPSDKKDGVVKPGDFRSRVCEAYLRDLPRNPTHPLAGNYGFKGGGTFLSPAASAKAAWTAASAAGTILGGAAFVLEQLGVPAAVGTGTSGLTLFTFTREADAAEKTMTAAGFLQWAFGDRSGPGHQMEWIPWGDTQGCAP